MNVHSTHQAFADQQKEFIQNSLSIGVINLFFVSNQQMSNTLVVIVIKVIPNAHHKYVLKVLNAQLQVLILQFSRQKKKQISQ